MMPDERVVVSVCVCVSLVVCSGKMLILKQIGFFAKNTAGIKMHLLRNSSHTF